MKLPLFQVDAFTAELFRGNPAAVVPLERWLDDDLMQAIALENNLSETAFFVPATSSEADYHLRWFTPVKEVDLCGHATLATSHVLFRHLGFAGERVRFESRSGPLAVERDGDRYVLDFPATPLEPLQVEEELVAALGARPQELWRTPERVRDGRLAVFADEREVRALAPDFRALARVGAGFAVATAPGDRSDFASRVFAPGSGIDEDPVTGVAHCALTPYWAERQGKRTLAARQVSARGGEVACELRGERVRLGGSAVTYLEGELGYSSSGPGS